MRIDGRRKPTVPFLPILPQFHDSVADSCGLRACDGLARLISDNTNNRVVLIRRVNDCLGEGAGSTGQNHHSHGCVLRGHADDFNPFE